MGPKEGRRGELENVQNRFTCRIVNNRHGEGQQYNVQHPSDDELDAVGRVVVDDVRLNLLVVPCRQRASRENCVGS